MPAQAYLDPGAVGMLSQLFYVALYGLLGALAFLGKPLAFLRKKKEPKEDQEETPEETDKEKAELATDSEEVSPKENVAG